MKNLVLIDGSSLLSSCFYGTLDRNYHTARTPEEQQVFIDKLLKTSDGVFINGVFGMLKSIEGMIQKVNPSHVVIAWDISRNTFRRQIYPAYKGTRKVPLPELKMQFPVAQALFGELGYAQYMFDEFEADDVIGTLATKFKSEIPVKIWTKDQDALQLIDGTDVKVWLITSKAKDYAQRMYSDDVVKTIPAGVFEFDEESFREIYEISPIQLIDKKAIEGDTSDNIPGIHGVGEKTTNALLKEFGSLEAIYDCFEMDSVDELKDMFKSIGISSPLKKMMDEVTLVSVIDELIESIDEISEADKEVIGFNENFKSVLIEMEIADKKSFKAIMKLLSNYEKCQQVIRKIGTFKAGKAKEIAFMSKKLATIVTAIPDLSLTLLDNCELQVVDIERKNSLMAKYEFKSLIK